MKTLYTVFAFYFILFSAQGASPISVEDFKNISDGNERARLIDAAPPEQREELRKIHEHLQLLTMFGGEAGVKALKEITAAKVRGFTEMIDVFDTQTQLWDEYMADVRAANRKAGMTQEKLIESEKKLHQDRAAVDNRLPIVEALVIRLAPTPEAMALEKKAEVMNRYMQDTYPPGGPMEKRHITKEQLSKVNRDMDEIFAKLQELPKLTSEQAQKEYEAITDDKVQP